MMPPWSRFAAPGKLVYIVGQSNWQSSFAGNNSVTNANWTMLGEELEKIHEPLSDVRTALKKTSFNAHLNYSAGFNLLLPHLARLRSAAYYLAADTLHELHGGDLDKALADLEALASLASCQEHEPLIISQLGRIAITQIGLGVTWQALQTPGWTDQKLARLQNAWTPMEFIGAMARSLEMERAISVFTYENARPSNKEADA